MPKAELNITLDDDASKTIKIVDAEAVGSCKVNLSSSGRILKISVEAEDEKSMISGLGSVLKQLRVIRDVKTVASASANTDTNINIRQ